MESHTLPRTDRVDNPGPVGVRILEPPLGDYAERVRFSWPDVREMVLTGRAADTSLDRFFVGEVGAEFAGSMMYAAPTDTRDVAALEFVWTEPQHRRNGVATELLRAALADFRAGGGIAMYLCTTNPHAYALYAAAGGRYRPNRLAGRRSRRNRTGSCHRRCFQHWTMWSWSVAPTSCRP